MRLACLVLLALCGTAAAAPQMGPAVDGLAIGIEVVDAKRPTIAIEIHNTSDHPITLLSHIATHEKQYDWYTIGVTWPLAKHKVCKGRGARTISLIDSREKSGPVRVTLDAGKSLRHEIDLGDWAARDVNGKAPFGGGTYELTVTYKVSGEEGVWNGALASAPVTLVRSGPRAADMCDH